MARYRVSFDLEADDAAQALILLMDRLEATDLKTLQSARFSVQEEVTRKEFRPVGYAG